MQIFVKISHTGKHIALEVEPNETLNELRNKIQEKEGIPPEDQRLYFAGKELSSYDNSTIVDLHIQKDSTIHLFRRYRPQFRVRTWKLTLSEEEYYLPYDPMASNENIKEQIEEISGIPSSQQILAVDGKAFSEEKRIYDYQDHGNCPMDIDLLVIPL